MESNSDIEQIIPRALQVLVHKMTNRYTDCQTVCIPDKLTDRHLSAAPGQASGDPVDGDVQVVHLAVVIWSWEVVGTETAEEQSQEEVQQLETHREKRWLSLDMSGQVGLQTKTFTFFFLL